MSLSEKPHLRHMAIIAYRRVLLLLEDKIAAERQRSLLKRLKWEKCVIYQQLGKLMTEKKEPEAEKLLLQLLEYVPGPEDSLEPEAKLFEGGFTFHDSRETFLAQTHKILAKLYYDRGDEATCKTHYNFSVNLYTKGGQVASKEAPAQVQREIVAEKAKKKIDWKAEPEVVLPISTKNEYSWVSYSNPNPYQT